MAIEFRCTQCGKLLRTADDTAGKQAKCPACGTVLSIPAESSKELRGPSPGSRPQDANAGSPPAMGDNPYASPSLPVGSAVAVSSGGEILPTRIDVGDVFSRAWTIFKDQMGLCIGIAVVAWLINFGVQMAIQMLVNIAASIARDEAIAVSLAIVGGVVNAGVNLWITTGQLHVFLRIARGERPAFTELFSGGRWFLPVLGAYILVLLAVGVGLLLLIVPGVIVALMLSQFMFLIIDRNLGVIESLKTSMAITAGNKLSLFVVVLAVFGLSIVAMIPCCLGFIVLVPYTAVLYSVAYLSMTGQSTATARIAT